MQPGILWTLARQEILIHIRSRWTAVFTAVFAGLALAIAYFGAVTAGSAGIQGFERTTASLLNLVLYLIPMVALTMGTLNLSRDRQANELLFSQPVGRGQILAGRLLGLFVSISAPTLLGFGAAGLAIFTQVGAGGVGRFLVLAGLSLCLAAVFLILGALAGILSDSRTKAFGVSLFLWFFFVLFYDLIVIGMAFVLKERTANLVIFLSLFGNPVDIVRVSSLLAISDPAIFGPAGAALMKFLGGAAKAQAALLGSLAAWILVPLWMADRALRRLDL